LCFNEPMNSKMTLTALVTGFPAGLRQPKPLPGENLFQLVIRNHPREWRNCVERLTSDFGVSSDQAGALLKGQLEVIQDAKVRNQIERFMNSRLPSHSRTFRCLKKLRDDLQSEPYLSTSNYEIIEILWPRQRDPSGDQTVEKLAAGLGVNVIPTPTDGSLQLNLADFLPHIHGQFLWLVPGGTKFMSAITALQLDRVMRYFQQMPRGAMYLDSAFSIIYRTSALSDLVGRGQYLSPESREMARNLDLAGYKFAADDDPEDALCELEPEYGGPRRKIQTVTESRSPWWKRIFGG
jgi:hypothetical protein